MSGRIGTRRGLDNPLVSVHSDAAKEEGEKDGGVKEESVLLFYLSVSIQTHLSQDLS